MPDDELKERNGAQPLRILILEDVPRDADLIQRELRRAGIPGEYRVLDTREEFIRALENFSPEVILSDYSMPQFTGLEALELKKEHGPDIPFLIVTGSQNEEIAVTCMKAGVDDYVLKEQLGRLPTSILTVLEKKSQGKVEAEVRVALEKASREWINTFDAVSNAIALVDREGKVQRCNRAMQGLLDRPFREILGLPLSELFGVALDKSESYPLQQALKSGHRESQVIEFEQRWFQVHVDPVSESGQAVGFLFIMADITERRQAEIKLRESEERFRLLVEQAPDAIAVFDVDENRFVQVNAQAEKLFGSNREELLRYGPQHYYTGLQLDGRPVAESVEENIDQILQGEEKTFLRVIHNAQGQELVCEVRLVRLPAKDRRLIRNSFIDVTSRKRAEQEQERLASEIRLLLESTGEGIYGTDSTGRCTFINKSGAEMLGYRPEEIIGQEIHAVIHHSHPDGSVYLHKDCPMYYTLLEGRQVRADDDILWRKDGTFFPANYTASPIREGNRIKGAVITFNDITERKRDEEALESSETSFRRLYESMADAYVKTDLEGRIREYNQSYKMMLGYEDEELWSLTYKDLTPEKWHAFEDEMVAKEVLIKGATSIYEKEYRKKDGTVFPVELRTFLLKDEKGEPSHMCAIVRDITSRRRMEEEREKLQAQFMQAQKMESVGRLASGVAHDFNNLLSVINGYSELAIDRLEEGDPLLANLQEVRRAGGRAASLTRQLLALSRKQVLSPEVLNLNGVIDNVEKMLRRLIGEDVTLATNLAEDLGMVKADIGQLEQVLMNLTVNARDAMPRGGKLSIETRNIMVDQHLAARRPGMAPGPYLLLTVSDTGTGMDRETQDQIFDPFFTTKEQGKGTGLGLSTVYGIVKQSGGHIEVYSELGLGTTFRIYLPRIAGIEVGKPADPTAEQHWEGKESVLLVEDEKAVRVLAKEFLTSAGYRVLDAADGMEALELVQQTREAIALLLTDVVMPKMSGLELADKLHLLLPKLKVLFMSGYVTDDLTSHLGSKNDLRLINKPFERAGLLKQVRKILDL
jgi:two-component system, cell cycle sensor histidine kinase and response regulator CckA